MSAEIMAAELDALEAAAFAILQEKAAERGVAALLEGFDFIGVERDAAHVATARKRIADAHAQLTLGAA